MTDRDAAQLFTLRIWPEAQGPGEIEWRGKVQHVRSGGMQYFRDWATLLDFLQTSLVPEGSVTPTN